MSKNDVKLALIDGDIVVYRSGFSAEHTIYKLVWDFGVQEFAYKRELLAFVKDEGIEEYEIESRLEVEPLENALHTVKLTIGSIIEATRPEDIAIFLSHGETFRDRVATIAKYKGNRDNQRRPEHYEDIRKYLIKYYGAVKCDGIEADDALADNQSDDTVICSIDKDLLQVPGKHYNWVTDSKTLVTPETAIKRLWKQVLTGDKTDNIPGIYRCGPKTAEKWLEDCTTEEEMRAVCIEKWEEYLDSIHKPKWAKSYSSDSGVLYYDHWNGDATITDATAESIVDEVYKLVKVGVS